MKILGFAIAIKRGRYYWRRFLPGRKQAWVSLTRVAQGEAALLAVLAELRARAEEAAGHGNLPALIAEFQTSLRLSPEVGREYARMYGYIARRFADFDADQVRPRTVLEFLARWSDKPTMRRAYKARLSQFFSWCVVAGHLDINPCREIRLPEPPKRRARLDAGMFWRIHDALPAKWQCFIALMFLTGQRSTEIRLLRESAIGPERLRFEPSKTRASSGEYVEVVITPEIGAELARARAIRDEERRRRERRSKIVAMDRGDEPLFAGRRALPYTRWALRCAWRDARKRAGLASVTSRDIRPFSLAALERAGYSLEAIRRAAAHTTTAMTEHYLNQHRDRVSAARLRMPERK